MWVVYLLICGDERLAKCSVAEVLDVTADGADSLVTENTLLAVLVMDDAVVG